MLLDNKAAVIDGGGAEWLIFREGRCWIDTGMRASGYNQS